MFALKSEAIPADVYADTPAQFPTDEIYATYLRELEKIRTEYRLRNPLDPENFRGNNFTDELLVKIIVRTRSTCGLRADEDTTEVRHLHNMYLELYKKVFTSAFIEKIRAKYAAVINKAAGRRKAHLEEVGVRIKGVPLRSFHILDDGGDSVKSFRITCNVIEAETGSSIAWNHLATYSAVRTVYDRTEHIKDASHWTKGVDGDGCTEANLRAWKNKIVTALKSIDLIVVNDVGTNIHVDVPHAHALRDIPAVACDLTASAIGFALSNLNVGGAAIISLRLSSLCAASTISLIHLFSAQFDCTNIIHTETEDRIFLCGTGLKSVVSARQYAAIMVGCRKRASIFSSEYMATAEFAATVETVANVFNTIIAWRLAQYTKLFRVYAMVKNSAAASMIRGHVDKLLDDQYPPA